MCMICQNPEQYSAFSASGGGTPQNIGSTSTMTEILAALNGSSWSSQGQAATLTYSFNGPWGQVAQGNYGGAVNQLSAADQAKVKGMLDQYAAVANLTFNEVTTGDGDIAVRNEYIAGSVGGYAYLPGNYSQAGNVTLDSQLGAITANSFSFYAAIHEFGHAMGLEHPFGGSASSPRPGGIPGSELNAGYTVMSYSDGPDASRADVTGLQLYDIAVLQYKYGANMTYKTGDDVYEFGSAREAYAIWDAGGNDTIKAAAGLTGSVNIDLRDGDYLNSVGSAKIKIAFNAQIENAIAGDGDDNVRGNELENYIYGGGGKDVMHADNGDDVVFGGKDQADSTDGADLLLGGQGADIVFGNGGDDTLIGGDGYIDTADGADVLFGGIGDDNIYGNGGDDTLIGAAGVDKLYGGVGNDTYVVGWGNGADLIYGFEGAGQTGGDKIQILKNANGNNINDFASLKAAMTDDGGNTLIDMGGGHGILIAGHKLTDFDAGDFEFV